MTALSQTRLEQRNAPRPLDQADLDPNVCPTCRETFASERGVKVHHKRIHGTSIAGVEVTCENCGDTYRVRRSRESWTRFCSDWCHKEHQSEVYDGDGNPNWRGGPHVVQCRVCGEESERLPYRWEETRRPFCSPECYEEYRRGRGTPREFGSAWLRHTLEELLSGQVPETPGADSCQTCGETENLHTHHLIPLKFGGTNSPENLMALCGSCHLRAEWFTRLYMTPILTEETL